MLKTWNRRDVWLLKVCAFLSGIAGGAYFHEYIIQYFWIIIIMAVILSVKPAIAYFKV